MPIKLKSANALIILIAVLMAALVVLNIMIAGNTVTAARSSTSESAKPTSATAPARGHWRPIEPSSVATVEHAAESADDEPMEAEVLEDGAEPTNYYNGMDPEDQPRAFMVQSLADLDPYAAGFAVTGGEVKVTEEGWTMAPPKEEEKNRPRSIIIESNVLALGFPSNSITPLWKEVSPSGTEVLIEVTASPDGENWTSWYPTTGAHMDGEISPTYPDGRPNPNYGFMMGDTAFFGTGLYQFYKFSITLYSETEEAPLVSDFRLYYQDSTMGDGYLVRYHGTDAPPEDLY